MEVVYEIDDGYVGHRPHKVKVNDDDLAECEDDEERQRVIENAVRDHFEQHISWYITSDTGIERKS